MILLEIYLIMSWGGLFQIIPLIVFVADHYWNASIKYCERKTHSRSGSIEITGMRPKKKLPKQQKNYISLCWLKRNWLSFFCSIKTPITAIPTSLVRRRWSLHQISGSIRSMSTVAICYVKQFTNFPQIKKKLTQKFSLQ